MIIEISQSLSIQENMLLLICESLFSNNLNQFLKLIEYCIQDVESSKTNKWKNIYNVMAGENGGRRKYYYGIPFYIINRLSFILFSSLMKYSKNKKLSFPYNWFVFIHCYPMTKGKKNMKHFICVNIIN